MEKILENVLTEWGKQREEKMSRFDFVFAKRGPYYKGTMECKECGEGTVLWFGQVKEIYEKNNEDYEFLKELVPYMKSDYMKFCVEHLAVEPVSAPKSFFGGGVFVFEPFEHGSDVFELQERDSDVWYREDYTEGRLLLMCMCYAEKMEEEFGVVEKILEDYRAIGCSCLTESLSGSEA